MIDLVNKAAGAASQIAGHYAFGANNLAGNNATIGYTLGQVLDPTSAAMSSRLLLYYMNAVNTTGGGTAQPNEGLILQPGGAIFPLGTNIYLDGATQYPSLTGNLVQGQGSNTMYGNGVNTGALFENSNAVYNSTGGIAWHY
ncbi:MAG TPA: hypothetical protein VK890_08985, partial [Bacteroidia bacterium]|nr:hypothetical protein [Bacteroidia bacterium]